MVSPGYAYLCRMRCTSLTPDLISSANTRLSLDLDTGKLYWKEMPDDFTRRSRCHNARSAGLEAGNYRTDKNGRRRGVDVMLEYVNVPAQYLVAHFCGMTLPDGCIWDHANGDPWDNRPCNIRPATRGQNAANKTSRGSALPLGVEWDKDRLRWRASIEVNGKRIRIGRHLTKGLAAVAYAKASLRHHGKYSPFARKTQPSIT